jgi:Holliday junction resolvasome RuvABC endonuclease subunit
MAASAPTLLAIDPGFRNTGWIVVRVHRISPEFIACGLIRTQKDTRKVLTAVDDWRCYRQIALELDAVMRSHGPRAVVVETPAGSKSVRAARAMASAFALCASVTELAGVPAVLVSADDAKLAATGKRNGSKAGVAAAVASFVDPVHVAQAVGRAKTKAEHITDAAALVLAAWDSDVVRLLRMSP